MADGAGEFGVTTGPTGESNVVSAFFVTIALCRAVINFGSLNKKTFKVKKSGKYAGVRFTNLKNLQS